MEMALEIVQLTERKTRERLEEILVKALSPIVCACGVDMKYLEKGSLSDPARIYIFHCPGCGKYASDFPEVVNSAGPTFFKKEQLSKVINA